MTDLALEAREPFPVARRRVQILGVFLPAAVGVAWLVFQSTVLLPRFFRVHAWALSRDLFVPLPAARYVANGAFLYMYTWCCRCRSAPRT